MNGQPTAQSNERLGAVESIQDSRVLRSRIGISLLM